MELIVGCPRATGLCVAVGVGVVFCRTTGVEAMTTVGGAATFRGCVIAPTTNPLISPASAKSTMATVAIVRNREPELLALCPTCILGSRAPLVCYACSYMVLVASHHSILEVYSSSRYWSYSPNGGPGYQKRDRSPSWGKRCDRCTQVRGVWGKILGVSIPSAAKNQDGSMETYARRSTTH